MIALGARVIDNSGMTIERTCEIIIADVNRRMAERGRGEVLVAEGVPTK
jgi:hypothetical protein